jgi:predicted nucleic acid-binding protein
MIVVSDTSPLHYLVLIDQVHVLPALFGRVLTTPLVVAELGRREAPDKVRQWLAQTPDWLEIQSPHSVPNVSRLGPGETEAIALAQELQADTLLIDERDGAKFARAQGMFVTGTLGVLQTGARRGLVSLADALTALRGTSFRYSAALFDELLGDEFNEPS